MFLLFIKDPKSIYPSQVLPLSVFPREVIHFNQSEFPPIGFRFSLFRPAEKVELPIWGNEDEIPIVYVATK